MYIEVNKRFLFFMALSIASHHVKSAIQYNDINPNKPGSVSPKNNTADSYQYPKNVHDETFEPHQCPNDVECSKLLFPCIRCHYNMSCLYGEEVQTTCEVIKGVQCIGSNKFIVSHVCRYCFLTERWEHDCQQKTTCNSIAVERFNKTNCTVKRDVFCLGSRVFPKMVECNWTRGYRWSTALIISITLGGFGVDRFYLGHWQEGIGKLFSFGGLGIWTLIDAILISINYLGPSDGSIYI